MTDPEKKHKRTLSKKEYWTERLHSLPSQNSDDEDSEDYDYYYDKTSLASRESDSGSIYTGDSVDIENPRLRPGIKEQQQQQQQQKSRRYKLCCSWTFLGVALLLAVLGALFWIVLMDCLGQSVI